MNNNNPFAPLFNKPSSNQSTGSHHNIHSSNHHQSPYHSSPQNYPPQQNMMFNQNPNLVNNQYSGMNQPIQPQNSFSHNYQQNFKQ